MKALLAILLALSLALPLSACSEQQENSDSAASETSAVPAEVIEADPERALEEIYKGIDIKEIVSADDELVTDTLGFDLDDVEDYFVRYSSGRYGLADVYIIKPYDDSYDVVRENLESIKLDRVRRTQSYDILDANKIAQNAEIYQYGSYLILLMLADNDRAREILQEYIPSTEAQTSSDSTQKKRRQVYIEEDEAEPDADADAE